MRILVYTVGVFVLLACSPCSSSSSSSSPRRLPVRRGRRRDAHGCGDRERHRDHPETGHGFSILRFPPGGTNCTISRVAVYSASS